MIEKNIIKSVIYGFIGGLYIGFLLFSQDEMVYLGDHYENEHLSIASYLIKIIRFSIIISLTAAVITTIFILYKKYISSNNQM
ncbi:hypothetical protein ACQKP0_02640 [Heyndrickxia sp. NPDC080065]|uniref:hypothetical protein n=1 Tax=Heyndrickxia sp. NPDC080065 TaxID=3390568 RepID=UPI003CFBE968